WARASHCVSSVPPARHCALASAARCSQSTSQVSGGGGLQTLAWQAARTSSAALLQTSALLPRLRQWRSTREARASQACSQEGGGLQCIVTQPRNSSSAFDLQSSGVPPVATHRLKSARACSSQSAGHEGDSVSPSHFSATQ